jgi:hypothetical protein
MMKVFDNWWDYSGMEVGTLQERSVLTMLASQLRPQGSLPTLAVPTNGSLGGLRGV